MKIFRIGSQWGVMASFKFYLLVDIQRVPILQSMVWILNRHL